MNDSRMNALLKRVSIVVADVLNRPEIAQDVKNCPVHLSLEIIDNEEHTQKQSIQIDIAPQLGSNDSVVLKADVSVWNQIFKEIPEPGYQSIGALRR